MLANFQHTAESLHTFFAQAGRGFYVPHYQRQYSWDDENAEKLVDDIFRGMHRALQKPSNTVFLGTVILHTEQNVQEGVHFDRANLLTKVSNVVDGQQRITSLAILSCVLSSAIKREVDAIESTLPSDEVLLRIGEELANQVPQLRDFHSVIVNRPKASPAHKPLIIRAGDVNANPVSDQWTESGDWKAFYRSNTASLLARFIATGSLQVSAKNERLSAVIQAFAKRIDDELDAANRERSHEIVDAGALAGGSLHKCVAYPPDSTFWSSADETKARLMQRALLLLAASAFLRNSCHVVIIECQDENLAFDMFQSLNATGTPLTAFEVFKPTIVREWGALYAAEIKPHVDRVDQLLEQERTAARKAGITDRLIVSSALVYNGKDIGTRFSEERDWLADSHPVGPSPASAAFVRAIADQGDYVEHVVVSKRPPRSTQSFPLVKRLVELGMDANQADLCALCIYYLREAKNDLAHTVISVFYARLLGAQGEDARVASASSELVSVCKATAAFFTLYMGAQPGRFPDAAYRSLFQGDDNMSYSTGQANQRADFLKAKFRNALEKAGVYNNDIPEHARQKWVDSAKGVVWYPRQTVCRFALFVAAHDAAPDITDGAEGLLCSGQNGSAPMLTCTKWHAEACEVVEHVGTRDRPLTPKFKEYPIDNALYPGNYSVVDRLGNLALLSRSQNSSIGSEWPEKVFFYWSMTTPTISSTGVTGAELKSRLGLTSVPPALAQLSRGGEYIPHLAPLAYRGQRGLRWDAVFVSRRSEHLCERVFNLLDAWLR
jgi:hypothetical protein